MLQRLQKRKAEGFTIIEVMIVLAIAGLILLIVFLAVPALQRSSRNTQRKNDVAAILAGVSEFSNNNQGTLPNGVWTVPAAGTVQIVGAAGTTFSQAKVGYYNVGVNAATTGYVDHVANGTLTVANTLNAGNRDYVIVATGTDCSGAASIPGSARSVTAVYEIESGSGTYAQVCQAS